MIYPNKLRLFPTLTTTIDAAGLTELFKPFTTYSTVNKPVMGMLIGGFALFGMLFFLAAFRKGVARMGTDEMLLGVLGFGFLVFAWYVANFIFTPRLLVEKDFFLISDFYRKRKLSYQEISALGEFIRRMPIRYNPNSCLNIRVLAIRLRSGKLIQFALPSSPNTQACLEAISSSSGLPIDSLGVDPAKLNEWRLEA